MDTVEIVMAIEKEFEIEIPDKVAAKLITVGMVSDYVCAALKARNSLGGPSLDENEILETVIKITSGVLGIEPNLINRNSNFVYDLGAD